MPWPRHEGLTRTQVSQVNGRARWTVEVSPEHDAVARNLAALYGLSLREIVEPAGALLCHHHGWEGRRLEALFKEFAPWDAEPEKSLRQD